ncbi:SpoIIE family protein phosphatase [bacterium LRH843]|nr:SpoIIE family protein phosphatase [bacterium LRH843]
MITYNDDKNVEVVILQRTKPGNSACGDAHTVIHTDNYTVCAVVDGLGSGEGARQSATAIIETIQACHHEPVKQIVEACNQKMYHMRGAVMTIIKINYSNRKVCYCNVGNVGFDMHLPNGKTFRPIPSRGYLSSKKQIITSNCFAYQHGCVFSLYSDGVIAPPTKVELMNMDSPRESAEFLFSKNDSAVDDLTLLVGKII